MEWRDNAIILALYPLGEHDVRAELLTPLHGRVFGVVKGGRSRRRRGSLQPGTSVDAVWRARIESQLGVLTIEPLRVRNIALAGGPARLAAMMSCCALASMMIAERDPHAAIHAGLEAVLDLLDTDQPDDDFTTWAPAIVRWELGLLAEAGSGLDLGSCAATGVTENLTHVSPRSGRAVSRDAAAPWRSRLLALPPFLREGGGEAAASASDVLDGLRLTGFFIERHLLAHDRRGLPDARVRLLERIAAAASSG
ncbi:MAG: DNA repair protein RecO [Sphingomonadales bacterium]